MNYYNILKSISLQNKYTNWYITLCSSRQLKYNKEELLKFKPTIHKHHILPKCFKLGGETDPLNIVHLTPREHFIAHLLLTKMFSCKRRTFQMLNAVIKMKKYKTTSRNYQNAIFKHSEIRKGVQRKPHSDKTKKKISESTLGRPAWNKGISYRKGIPKTVEMKEKLSTSKLGNKSKSSYWKITNLETNHSEIIFNLKQYCIDNNFNYGTLSRYTKPNSNIFQNRILIEKLS